MGNLALDNIAICNIIFADCNKEFFHETRRQTAIPPLRGRFAPRIGPFDDPAGTRCRVEAGAGPRPKSGVSLPNREWRQTALDAHDARAFGAILPRLSRIFGGRPGGLHARVAV